MSDIEINSPEIGTTSFQEEYQNSEVPESNNIKEKFKNNTLENDEGSVDSTDNSIYKVKQNKHKIIYDSDSEEEGGLAVGTTEDTNENLTTTVKPFNEKKHKRLAIVDSDSEEDANILTDHKSSDDIINSNEQPVFVINSEGNLIPENANHNKSISQVIFYVLIVKIHFTENYRV